MHGFIALLLLMFYKIQNYWLYKCCEGVKKKKVLQQNMGIIFQWLRLLQPFLNSHLSIQQPHVSNLPPKNFILQFKFKFWFIISKDREKRINIPNRLSIDNS